ncbi:AI-2E family transporter [Dermabacteraceae bacterium CCM 9519]
MQRNKNTAPVPAEVAEIPMAYRRMAAWGWRFLVIVAVGWVLVQAIAEITTLVIPVLIAALLASLLLPLVKLLTRHTFLPRSASAAVAMLGLVVLVGGMFTLAGRQLTSQWEDIEKAAIQGFRQVTDFAGNTFQLNDTTLQNYVSQITDKLQENSGTILSGALSGFSTASNVLAGIIISLFTLFFLLSGGERIWRWMVCLLPAEARIPAHESFRRGWQALSGYVRTQILVAAVDAVGIALGMVIVSLGGYAVPIGLVVFLFSFIPIVGAIVSGAIAVLLALVLKGWVAALIVMAVVLVVQQLESNILQPFLMGQAVNLHPLAVFLGVAVGTLVAGIPGALFSVPAMAFINSTLVYATGRAEDDDLGEDRALHRQFFPGKSAAYLESPDAPAYLREPQAVKLDENGEETAENPA